MPENEEPHKMKKVAARFTLNTDLQPLEQKDSKGKIRKCYPLYVHVTYNRKSMRFKSKCHKVFSHPDEVDILCPGFKEFEEKLIEKVIRFEHSLIGLDKPYEMKGLKDRYETYTDSIASVVEKYLRQRLIEQIVNTRSGLVNALDLVYHKENKNDVLVLYQVSEILFENFKQRMNQALRAELETYKLLFPLLNTKVNQDFPMVIDSMDDEFRTEFKSALSSQNAGNDYVIRAFNLIDIAVRDTVKKMMQEAAARKQNTAQE